MCDAIYISNTQQTHKKRMDNHFSDLQLLLKRGKKSDSLAAHFVEHFNATTSRTYLRKYTALRVANQINPTGSMKRFTKPNCNLFMDER